MLYSKRGILLGSCAVAALTSPAMAQETAAGVERDTIVVTAQNRTQDLQDVPIRIDVVDADQLAESGFSSANDLSKIAPVAQVQQDQGEVNIFVRGIGTIAGNDTAVVSNVDGEYINSPAVLGISIFDLERVEVLRGPQGTLYGRNSTAGAVNFIARKPGDMFAANASVSYGNYDSVRVDAGVDVPLGTGVGIRASGFYEDRDGYVKHPAQPARNFGFQFPAYGEQTSDDNKAYGGRLSFLADSVGSAEGLTVYLAAEYSKREFTPQTFAYADLNSPANSPGANCGNPGFTLQPVPNDVHTYCIPTNTNFLEGVDRGFYEASANPPGFITMDTWAVRGRIDYEFSPEATLSYIAGYREFDEGPSVITLPVVYTNYTFENTAKTQSHELRLAGEFDSGFVYQVGGFYFKEDIFADSGFYLGSPTDGFFLEYTYRGLVSDSWSLFGQVEYPVTDQITLVGGLRYTDNSREAAWRDKAGFFVGPEQRVLDDTNSFASAFTQADNKVTWLAGVNFEPTEDTLVYAKVTTGFKAGGFNNGFDGQGNPNPPFNPETNIAYEGGVKHSFGEFAQHTANLTGFYYDYTGLQVSTIISTEDGGLTYNAGSATIWGLEADVAFEITENDFFQLTVNYLDAELNDLLASYNVTCIDGPDCDGITSVPLFPENDPTTPNPGTNYSGNTPAYAPSWIITAGYEHIFDLGNSGTLGFSANTTFKSSFFTTFRNYSDGKQDSFTQTDLQLEWQDVEEQFSVALFVRNLENERPLTQGYFLAAGPDDIYNWQFGSPRLYGLRLGFEY